VWLGFDGDDRSFVSDDPAQDEGNDALMGTELKDSSAGREPMLLQQFDFR
jgi:hypothetical protein